MKVRLLTVLGQVIQMTFHVILDVILFHLFHIFTFVIMYGIYCMITLVTVLYELYD
jgi:hypothetical protein